MMMTKRASPGHESILGLLPDGLRGELLTAYSRIVKNYRERRWEPSELSGGKFCEVVYTVLRGHVDGSFPAGSKKPRNMVDACRALEQVPSTYPRAVRIQIPRMLIALYEVRNNRGVGHVGGDVDPNHMDATCVLQMSKWILSELVRLFHDVDTETASDAIESIVERLVPIVWEVDGKLRVLDTNLTMKEKTLIVLYYHSESLRESDLVEWLEYSNASVYRKQVLGKSHKERLIEYNQATRMVTISPKGIEYVEDRLLS
jgi:hypothetical protein